ncbi:MAG TPA: DUF481 domain-containing protein [Kangiella sp.]|uniref:DUF481 domain-containing protein n=1 Tax=Kangiella sp. TaxID=1920245 RepID=UPI002F93A100
MNFKKSLVALAVCFSSPTVLAQSGLLSDAPEEGYIGTLDIGYISTSGNTETESLNGAFKYITRISEEWSTGIHVTGMSSENDEVRESERYTFVWNNRYDLSERSFVYSVVDYMNDYFGAYDYQAGAYVGYGHEIFNDDSGHFSLGLGLGYRINALEAGDDETENVVRGDLDYLYNISETATFTQAVTAIWGQDLDTYSSETALRTSISESLSLKLAYHINYNSEVPVGAEKRDTTTTVSVSYSF